MNSDQIPIMFLTIHFLLELFVYTAVKNDNYSVKNANYLVKNANYLVKKCLIFPKYLEIN